MLNAKAALILALSLSKAVFAHDGTSEVFVTDCSPLVLTYQEELLKQGFQAHVVQKMIQAQPGLVGALIESGPRRRQAVETRRRTQGAALVHPGGETIRVYRLLKLSSLSEFDVNWAAFRQKTYSAAGDVPMATDPESAEQHAEFERGRNWVLLTLELPKTFFLPWMIEDTFLISQQRLSQAGVADLTPYVTDIEIRR